MTSGSSVSELVEIFLIVFGVNLMPALGPPTWSILVLYRLKTGVPAIPLVIIGALAAALGRFALAYAFRLIGDRLPTRMKRNLETVRLRVEQRKRGMLIGLGLFALSPVPSAQLFEAAGLARVRLAAFTIAFFAGRLVSYSIYVAITTSIQSSSLGDELTSVITSPQGLLLEIAMVTLLVLLTQINWTRHLGDGER